MLRMSWWEQILKILGFNPVHLRWRWRSFLERFSQQGQALQNRGRILTLLGERAKSQMFRYSVFAPLILVTAILSSRVVFSSPARWGMAFNVCEAGTSSSECQMDAGSGTLIEMPAGKCCYLVGKEEVCCNMLGLKFVAANIGQKSGNSGGCSSAGRLPLGGSFMMLFVPLALLVFWRGVLRKCAKGTFCGFCVDRAQSTFPVASS
jgi:hypothetical protein